MECCMLRIVSKVIFFSAVKTLRYGQQSMMYIKHVCQQSLLQSQANPLQSLCVIWEIEMPTTEYIFITQLRQKISSILGVFIPVPLLSWSLYFHVFQTKKKFPSICLYRSDARSPYFSVTSYLIINQLFIFIGAS